MKVYIFNLTELPQKNVGPIGSVDFDVYFIQANKTPDNPNI